MSREPDAMTDAIPPAAVPPAELEDRVVEALYAEGLLGRPARDAGPLAAAGTEASSGRPAYRRPARAWWPLAAAASVAFFAVGFAVGQLTGSRSTADALIAAREADATATAAFVQQAGTAYVQALAALADRTLEGAADGAAADQGEAAALAAFTAAAAELTRLAPENETAHQVLSLLTTRAGGEPSAASSQTLWF